MSRSKDLIGQKFGRLTIVEKVENYISPKGQVSSRWLCRCDCGNQVVVLGKRLSNNKTKSCGCLYKEIVANNNKIYKKSKNNYDLSGEFGIGYTSKGEQFYFDLEDYDKIKDYCWCIGKKGAIISNDKYRKTVLFHRIVLGVKNSNLQVDHIKHKRYDNRKSQLRIVDNSKNQMNTDVRNDNTSGCKGVAWHKKQGKWYVYINVNKHRIHLGYFADFEEAVRIRKEAEEKYFGNFSYDNSIKVGVYNDKG